MLRFLADNWQAVSSTIGAIILWVYRRPLARITLRNEKINADTGTLNNLEKSLQLYIAMLNDIEKRHDEQLHKRDKEIMRLEEQIELLKNRIRVLEEDYEK